MEKQPLRDHLRKLQEMAEKASYHLCLIKSEQTRTFALALQSAHSHLVIEESLRKNFKGEIIPFDLQTCPLTIYIPTELEIRHVIQEFQIKLWQGKI